MLQYLGDLMEDTVDFSWQNAKEAHAVLLCEMEQGNVSWFHTNRIDRIRRAHAQRHNQRANWQKTQEVSRKPWFCKLFQTGQCSFAKDHDTNGKLHRHVCAQCLGTGKIANHPSKDCFSKRQSKNE